MSIDLDEFRKEIPAINNYIYLNHAAISPTPVFALLEALGYLYGVSSRGSVHVNRVEENDFLEMRQRVASFIGAEASEVSFIPNTSFGINMIIHGLNLGKGDVVLTNNLEFPATVYPLYKLRERGVEVKLLRVEPGSIDETMSENIDERVRLVVVSHVSFNTGARIDIKKIKERAKKVGALLLVDAIQSAGALKLDVKETEVDFLLAGGYKWLMSPQGSGFMYVRKGLLKDPPFYGWKTSSTFMKFDSESFELETGPRRFEIGTIDVSANLAMSKIAEKLTPERERIERRVLDLSAHTVDEAEDMNFEVVTPKHRRAGITVVRTENPKGVAEKLLQKKIVVSPRGNGIRISTHFYNTEDEVSEALKAIKSCLS
ncbi:aminotransferase class V-fold PLP-dependent enzyme [Metallosphaera tengchongensis]|uniref:Aminotransferase class V-fold PLP-dependent enzyme n=1 Tax=Metallosphaera tengchongensis TaxID=1532350 RepID=A0A6N0NZ28_9CREN|nr:aminotransferase class V-fold PLP-dependent enzyme [Metallosphaera tengchongensis]QKR00401.1 aminotransferase class V-fold PLP-dependent enzyme [Metallosphaera tengchongensis]